MTYTLRYVPAVYADHGPDTPARWSVVADGQEVAYAATLPEAEFAARHMEAEDAAADEARQYRAVRRFAQNLIERGEDPVDAWKRALAAQANLAARRIELAR